MQCTNPDNYYPNGVLIQHKWPCGKCLPCRMKFQREWASRLILERRCHDHAIFFTLTYDEQHCPTSLEKPDVQKFVKRFRMNTGQQPRYFICGEYGSRFGRPHYHGIFFGLEMTYEHRIARRSQTAQHIVVDPRIEDNWQLGSTYSKGCDTSTAGNNITRYVASYVVKDSLKWSDSSDDKQKSEWALQSRRPYIGQPAVKSLCESLSTKNGAILCGILGTVPNWFRQGGYRYQIPLRIRREMAYELGYECLPVPANDGTLIDTDKGVVLRGAEIPIKTLSEAAADENAIRHKFAAKASRAKIAQAS